MKYVNCSQEAEGTAFITQSTSPRGQVDFVTDQRNRCPLSCAETRSRLDTAMFRMHEIRSLHDLQTQV